MIVATMLTLMLAGQAADPTSAAAPLEAPSPPPPPPSSPMVCRMETIVGSRFPTRVCMSQSHREARENESRAMARMVDRGNANRGRVLPSNRPRD